ncbi:hypothetical protein DPEC_G00121480 [Dallia pectoralis]|uniref:Uncharacterized protein n=1 Tax=Dallia pectoralis TaxID=75939 RepID=A0ACC2GQ47_DALPE|nr:hypothetical protein DPEC_G00121480 [Dallia pectoralis]
MPPSLEANDTLVCSSTSVWWGVGRGQTYFISLINLFDLFGHTGSVDYYCDHSVETFKVKKSGDTFSKATIVCLYWLSTE